MDTQLVARPNDTTAAVSWNSSLLYVNTRPGAKSDVGFVPSGNASYTTTGWEFYGRQLLWEGNDTSAGAGRAFWASSMSALDGGNGFYKLFWNADNTALNDAVPVVIKRLPPPSIQ